MVKVTGPNVFLERQTTPLLERSVLALRHGAETQNWQATASALNGRRRIVLGTHCLVVVVGIVATAVQVTTIVRFGLWLIFRGCIGSPPILVDASGMKAVANRLLAASGGHQ